MPPMVYHKRVTISHHVKENKMAYTINTTCVAHDRKVGCNNVKYTTTFLYSDWLYFLWHGINIHIHTQIRTVTRLSLTAKTVKFERKCKEWTPVSSASEDWMICLMCFMAASAMSTTLSTITLPSVSEMWQLHVIIKINKQLLDRKGKSMQ